MASRKKKPPSSNPVNRCAKLIFPVEWTTRVPIKSSPRPAREFPEIVIRK